MVHPTAAVAAIPATTPFIGPEQLMRETGQRELVRLGANESAFGPSPKAVAAMSAELPRLAWYGDPESLDLRDALAEKHRCRPEQIVVGSGIDDLMGLAVRAFVAPGDPALSTCGTYPTFNYHVIGYGGRPISAPYRDDGTPDCDALLEIARRETPPVVYLANPDNPSGRFVGRDELARFYDALPHSTLLLLDEAYADFVDEDELLPPIFEDRLDPPAHVLQGVRHGGRADRLRPRHRTQSSPRSKRSGCSTASIATRRSARWRRLPTRSFDSTSCARPRAPATTTIAWRAIWAGATSSRGRTSSASTSRRAERATRVMDELLARGVWIRKPGAPPLDRYIRVSAGTEPMRRAFEVALRAVLAEVSAGAG